MNAEITLIISLSLILLLSPFISNILKLPITMVEIFFGAVLAGAGFIYKNEMFNILAEVGFLYLMLLAGMEVNLKELFQMDRKVLLKSLAFLAILYFFAISIVFILNLSKVFIVILPLISIGLMISIQQEIGKKNWLNFAIKVGIWGEVLSIVILTIISGYFKFGINIEFFKNIATLFIFMVFLGFVYILSRSLFWWFPTLKHYLMPDGDKYHQDIRIAMSLFFIMIAFLLTLHLDVVLGAFVVGMFTRTFFDHNHKLEDKLAPFGFGFLVTIFFVHVGSSLNLQLISLSTIIDSFILVLIMIILRVISSFIFLKELGFKRVVLMGFSLSMPLTLLIATATLAHQNNIINDYLFNVLVFTSVLEVIVVMVSIKLINLNVIISQKKDNK
jgi:Kef-type K+ transport system membrane component KefB